MVAILTETRNAMVKQYTKLFSMEGVRLTVTKDALRALAAQAVTKGTGARALRSMLERIMLDIMYEVPSREDIAEVTINRAVVEGKKVPLIRKKQDKDAAYSRQTPNAEHPTPNAEFRVRVLTLALDVGVGDELSGRSFMRRLSLNTGTELMLGECRQCASGFHRARDFSRWACGSTNGARFRMAPAIRDALAIYFRVARFFS